MSGNVVSINDSKAAADAVSKVLKTIGGLSEAQQTLAINSLNVFLSNAKASAPVVEAEPSLGDK